MKLAADSSDAPSKANAGLIGPISLNDLSRRPAQESIEAMKDGEVSAVDSHAARLPDLQGRDADRVADDAVRAGARADQRPHRSPASARTSSRSTSTKLRAQAIIEWKNPDVKKAFDEGSRAGAARPTLAELGRATGSSIQTQLQWFADLDARRGTNRSSASSSSASTSRRFSRRSRAGAGGRTARRRSTGRCFPATASRASIRPTRCRS